MSWQKLLCHPHEDVSSGRDCLRTACLKRFLFHFLASSCCHVRVFLGLLCFSQVCCIFLQSTVSKFSTITSLRISDDATSSHTKKQVAGGGQSLFLKDHNLHYLYRPYVFIEQTPIPLPSQACLRLCQEMVNVLADSLCFIHHG
jgi:hypothetical protein